MDTNDSYGTLTAEPLAEQQSLVGPAHAPEDAHVAAHPEPTQEEIAKMLAVMEEHGLGIYSAKDLKNLVEVNGKKIIPDPGNPRIAVDAETAEMLVQHESGAWLAPTDKEYAEKKAEVTAKPESEAKTPEKIADHKEHEQLENDINAMMAQNAGSPDAKNELNTKVAQRMREGASTMELKTVLKPLVATAEHFAISGAADVNPEVLGHMHPAAISPGTEKAYADARAKMEQKNAQFSEMLRRKEKNQNG